MTLIETIKSNSEIADFIKPKCEDGGICVEIDESVSNENYVIIKVDEFYNSLKIKSPPPSVDCLIVQLCSNGSYRVLLVELKNVKQAKLIDNKNLTEKFRNTLFDFMSNRFKSIFDEHEFRTQLLLCAGRVNDELNKSLTLDFLLGLRPIKFRNKLMGIDGYPPTPTIKPC